MSSADGPDDSDPHGQFRLSTNSGLLIYGAVTGPLIVGLSHGLAILFDDGLVLTVVFSAVLVALAGQHADELLVKFGCRD